MKDSALILRIELLNLTRSVWRDFAVPENTALDQLHEFILMVMPWAGDHLHVFLEKRNERWTPLTPPDQGVEEQEEAEAGILLRGLLKAKGAKIRYAYDFGDDWTHEITLLGYGEPGSGDAEPRCLAGEGAAPLDDCGGPPGDEAIAQFVAARKIGRHNKSDPLNDWVPEDYDPACFSVEEANLQLGLLDLLGDMPEGLANVIEEGVESDQEGHIPESYNKLSRAEIAAFRKLLRISHEIMEIAPWHFLADFNLIGWEDPDDRKIRLISVLGANDEVYSLQVHLPDRGYKFWKKAYEDDLPENPDDCLSLLHMYEVEFIDPAELEAGDVALYEATDQQVPEEEEITIAAVRFRFYHPHKFPYHITPEQAKELFRILASFLSFAKEQFYKREKYKALIKRLPEQNGLPKTIPTLHLPPGAKDKAAAWKLLDRPVPWELAELSYEEFDPPVAEIFRLAGLPESEEIWEIGSARMHAPILTYDGPVVGILALVGRVADGYIYPPHLESDWTKPYGQIVWEAFCIAADNLGFRPKELHIASDIAERTFTPVAEHGTFTLRRNPRWTVISEPLLKITTTLPPD